MTCQPTSEAMSLCDTTMPPARAVGRVARAQRQRERGDEERDDGRERTAITHVNASQASGRT